MLSINNRNLCEFCFSELSGASVCSNCEGARYVQKFNGVLRHGTVLAGKYVVGRVLGKGGFGITYQCYDLAKNRIVAIKEYMPDSLSYRVSGTGKIAPYSDEKGQHYKSGEAKFLKEAKLLSKFNGRENITSVYEFFYENNTAYYVMEYLAGIDLKKYIERHGGKISEAQVLVILKAIANALVDIHGVKVLHRDISPDNIFICRDGSVKLIDFGAARQLISEASNSLSVILKHGYAPFEQYQKKGNQGPWTDLYALGATAYLAITGKMIPDAVARTENEYVNMSGISPQTAGIISKMIACNIKSRYTSAKQLLADLRAIAPDPVDSKSSAAKTPVSGKQQHTSESRVYTNPDSNDKRNVCVCSVCGRIVPQGYTVCAKCNTQQSAGTYQGQNQTDKNTILIVAAVIMVIFLIAVVYFGFFYEKSYKPINIYEMRSIQHIQEYIKI